MLLIGWGVIRYLQGSGIFEVNNKYYAVYEQVGGIRTASNVTINGVVVGTVLAVNLNENPTLGVEVEFTVDSRYKIPVDSKATRTDFLSFLIAFRNRAKPASVLGYCLYFPSIQVSSF